MFLYCISYFPGSSSSSISSDDTENDWSVGAMVSCITIFSNILGESTYYGNFSSTSDPFGWVIGTH